MIDAEGNEIELYDCVERRGDMFAVIGMMVIHGEDVVILGEVVGGDLAAPYCEKAEWLKRVNI